MFIIIIIIIFITVTSINFVRRFTSRGIFTIISCYSYSFYVVFVIAGNSIFKLGLCGILKFVKIRDFLKNSNVILSLCLLVAVRPACMVCLFGSV